MKIVLVLDSGCTNHIVNMDKYFYCKVRLKYSINVKLTDGFIIKATHIGNIRVRETTTKGKILLNLRMYTSLLNWAETS